MMAPEPESRFVSTITPASSALEIANAIEPATDIDGDLRPQGAGPDIGADEYCAAGNGACSPAEVVAQQNVGESMLTDPKVE